jgi:hypothetical protein
MIVGLSANQMGWHIAAECCGSHAGSASPEKHPHNVTPPAEIIRSPTPHLTKTERLEPKISNLDSNQRTDFHWSDLLWVFSSFVVVLMKASFIIELDGFCNCT